MSKDLFNGAIKSKIELIQEKYSQLDEKMNFVNKMSEKTGLNFFTVKNHHFGNKWNIPKKYIDIYLEELDKELNALLK